MPAEMLQTRRRYLSIQDGRMCERIEGDTPEQYSVQKFNHLSRLHLINVTFRAVEKEENGVKKTVGHVVQLHLIDSEDYFVVETWVNSQYAKAFYQVWESIDLNHDFVVITDQRIKEGKKKPALFVKQFGNNLKWNYVKDAMKDCPKADFVQDGDKWLVDDEAQMAYFLGKVNNILLPKLKAKANPYPSHPIYGDGSGRAATSTGLSGPSNLANDYPEDDLPF
ncbi:hypothetical protein LZZ85_11275 [Terrimonas sp. NA20]|uniref:DUF669 domain-containing protein n=1 Tax=Terrimonas ginsenosidimutans TaxID=2908004 RepID=A0ABS9KRC3_9BACT|nr:hypothetical protein [Terrimonas ginsenosidimutans]MCG2614869.1 hypothetical protein [Terrimonas ginsenosidimutans]